MQQERPLASRISRQSHCLLGQWPLRDGQGRNFCCVGGLEANFECEQPAQISRRDPLIHRYLDKATAFSGAYTCVRTTEMPWRDGKSRNCPAERDWELCLRSLFRRRASTTGKQDQSLYITDISAAAHHFLALIRVPRLHCLGTLDRSTVPKSLLP